MNTPLELDGESLTIETLWRTASLAADTDSSWRIQLGDRAIANLKRASHYREQLAESGSTVYGINTGFGYFANTRISSEDITALQQNIILSHCSGVGAPLSRPQTLAMWLILLNSACRGHRGLHPDHASRIVDILNRGILAIVPSRGSVGASGDLAPMAHAVAAVIGHGDVTMPDKGKFVTLAADEALRRISCEPLTLGPKEGLCLINGTQLTAALAAQAWMELNTLLHSANRIVAMTIEAMRASHAIVMPQLIAEQHHESTRQCAEEIRQTLQGPTEISKSHAECERVQDPYSIRCAPQVHGAVLEELLQSKPVLEDELNATTDNPILFPDDDLVIHGGNFHAIYPARICDRLASAAATLACISERRIHMMMKNNKSGLPDFLIKDGGLNSGLMMAQTAAAALVSECKSLSFPASVDSISTNNDQEDHVSMGPIAGHKALQVMQLLQQVLAVELMAACQGLDLLAPLTSSQRIETMKKRLRQEVDFLEQDRMLAPDIDAAARLIGQGDILTIQ